MSETRPLSVAIVTGSASRLAGGLFNSVRRCALALSEAGHCVTVLALADKFASEDISAWAPLVPLTAARRGPSALGYGPAIGAALRASTFDVVHQHGIWQAFSMQVSAWRRRTNGPIMISPRGMLDPWAIGNASWRKQIASTLYERKNLAGAQCLHALNTAEAQFMRSFGLSNPIAIIPNSIDLPADTDVSPPKWWPDGKVLLFIGRIHQKKGVAELIEAFALCARRAANLAAEWRLVIAGWDDGGNLASIQEAVGRHGLNDRVIMPGPIYGAEKAAALRHATAFVLPSYSEGLPMSVLEAWAYRLPVLMTDGCNLPEGFAAGAAERITTDPNEMAAQLELLLASSSGEALMEIGLRGRALVEVNYRCSEIIKQHTDVYQWMTGEVSDTPSCIVLN